MDAENYLDIELMPLDQLEALYDDVLDTGCDIADFRQICERGCHTWDGLTGRTTTIGTVCDWSCGFLNYRSSQGFEYHILCYHSTSGRFFYSKAYKIWSSGAYTTIAEVKQICR